MPAADKKIIVRAYGILRNEKNEVLLVRELIHGKYYTKFPGGGLEFGEGLKDCIVREFKEEASLEVEVTRHFYTTDFFQESLFSSDHQVISVYYLVRALSDLSTLRLDEFEIVTDGRKERLQFMWIPAAQLNENSVDLPIDKVVCSMLAAGK